jgi:hypothetical protein
LTYRQQDPDLPKPGTQKPSLSRSYRPVTNAADWRLLSLVNSTLPNAIRSGEVVDLRDATISCSKFCPQQCSYGHSLFVDNAIAGKRLDTTQKINLLIGEYAQNVLFLKNMNPRRHRGSVILNRNPENSRFFNHYPHSSELEKLSEELLSFTKHRVLKKPSLIKQLPWRLIFQTANA